MYLGSASETLTFPSFRRLTENKHACSFKMKSGIAVDIGDIGVFAALPLTSWARAFHVLEYWMQCPHQEEKNWTSQAEDEFVTVGLRLLLLRITSGSSSVYRRAAARTGLGTRHSTARTFNQNRNIPVVLPWRHTPRPGYHTPGGH